MPRQNRLSREFMTYLALFGVARAMGAFWFKPQYSEFASFHYPFAALSDNGGPGELLGRDRALRLGLLAGLLVFARA